MTITSTLLKRKLLIAATGSAAALSAVLVSYHEGRRLYPYKDSAGVLTVCDGITGKDVIPGKTYTDAECDALLVKHLTIARKTVKDTIKTPLNEWQEAALTDFVFNIGAGAFKSSTLVRKFNAGDIQGGCDELLRWTKATVGGKKITLRGLQIRRENDHALCTQGAQALGETK